MRTGSFSFHYGAPGRDRTGDLRVTNALLCQLSHGSKKYKGGAQTAKYCPRKEHAVLSAFYDITS